MRDRGPLTTGLLTAACVMLAGCGALPWKAASKPVEAQKGGYALGAGASLVQPVNSAQPSTQVAERETWFQEEAGPLIADVVPVESVAGNPVAAPGEVNPVRVSIAVPPPPRPAYKREKVTTSLGAHQDLKGIIDAAGALLKQTSMLLWFGIMATVGGAFAVAWSMGNERGYMVVSVMVLALGITWLIVPPSNWWLLLAILPLGAWLMQQEGIVKLVRRAAGVP